jgi:hypothetical protein
MGVWSVGVGAASRKTSFEKNPMNFVNSKNPNNALVFGHHAPSERRDIGRPAPAPGGR